MEGEIYKMIYKINKKDDHLIILGKDFVKNNKNKGKLIIKNKKHVLKETIQIEDTIYNIFENKIKIKMFFGKDISNLSYMLKNCELLLNFLNDDIENFTEKESKEKEENKILFDFVNTVDESDHPMLKNLKEIRPSEIPKIEEENSNSSSL